MVNSVLMKPHVLVYLAGTPLMGSAFSATPVLSSMKG